MDRQYRSVELIITIDEFHRLPRNAAYKYEYFGGRGVLSPRPKAFNCVRDLSPVGADPVEVRPLSRAEAPQLADLFFGAVRQTQPFQSLTNEQARAAADECFGKTHGGEDGPPIEAAWFQAYEPRREHVAGGILITLVPDAVLTDPFAGTWKSPPPPDDVERRLGVPHLTWVFVSPWEARHGIGTALLDASLRVLRDMGFTALASTFLLDNGPSALWH
jgi:hypothetical protein